VWPEKVKGGLRGSRLDSGSGRGGTAAASEERGRHARAAAGAGAGLVPVRAWWRDDTAADDHALDHALDAVGQWSGGPSGVVMVRTRQPSPAVEFTTRVCGGMDGNSIFTHTHA
jgi:hypothetical protein